jgi:HSP90 family molecular chaperone
MSSSMRMMMTMMDKDGSRQQDAHKDQTLEINPSHPIIVNLNHLRKTNAKLATLVSKQLIDNVMLQSGVPFD